MILNRKMQAFWELNFEDQCEGEEGEGEIAALVPPPAPTMPDEDFFSLICRLQVLFLFPEEFIIIRYSSSITFKGTSSFLDQH